MKHVNFDTPVACVQYITYIAQYKRGHLSSPYPREDEYEKQCGADPLRYKAWAGGVTKKNVIWSYMGSLSHWYSRGSLHETLTWLTKAKNRGLINVEDFDSIRKDLDTIGLKLNNYIKSIGPKKKNNKQTPINDQKMTQWQSCLVTAKWDDLMTNYDSYLYLQRSSMT